ncbi:MAG: HlyD family efflux transporter periplasmic adaptor subunit [Christensenella sp.]|nr:HlyD family efflux transporter periplasmic adaptor subunit [Christensenella sp.]
MQVKKKKSRVWLWVLLAVVVTIAVIFALLQGAMKRAAAAVYVSHTIETGTVERTITGSGRLASADSETIRVPGDIRVSSIPAKVGDFVKSGDVLAALDLTSLSDQTAKISGELADLDAAISSRSRVKRVESPARGRVKFLPTKKGDDVLSTIGEYGALAILSTDGKMQLEIAAAQQLVLHSEVSVKWDGGSADGLVEERTPNGYLVTLTDNGTPYQATAQVYSGDQLLGAGLLSIHAPVSILAAGGEVTDVAVDENTLVYAGNKLFSLENAPDSASYRTSFSERADKAALYEVLLGYLNDPYIRAKTDGFVNEVMISEDAVTPSATTTDGLIDAFTIHTGGAVKMSIDADELDIDAVQLGQTASVTLDAYPGESFEATVTRISRIGTVDGTITTYPVEVTLGYDERLLEGMNGSAVILTSKKENVVLLPLDLINEDADGEYVFVKSADGKSYDRADITTGLSDGTNAEVTSGLSAGDIIWYVSKPENPYSGMPGMRYAGNRTDGEPTPANGGE